MNFWPRRTVGMVARMVWRTDAKWAEARARLSDSFAMRRWLVNAINGAADSAGVAEGS
jgi:hypothetical protein